MKQNDRNNRSRNKGKKYQLSKGMTLEEIAKEFQKEYKYPILLAKVNNKLEELTNEVDENSK